MNLRWLPLALVGATWGCKSVPEGRVGVASIRFEGNGSLRGSDLRNRIATQEAPKFLGLFRASWERYEDFEPEVLEKDLQRIEHYYRRRGYYDTEVRVGRVLPQGQFVDVEILIRQGKEVRVRTVAIAGLEGKPRVLALRAQEGIILQPNDIFDQEKFEGSSVGVALAMSNQSYAHVVVTPQATVDLGPHTADLAFHIELGIPCTVGPITFEGLGELPENLTRRAFDVKSGDRYETEDLEMGRRALLNLGVFASVEVVPDLSNPQRPDVPVKVVVTRSALRGVRIGGGLTIDFTRTDIHGLVTWEHRNFLGGMRHFLIEERPSLVLFPTALSDVHAPSHIFPANSIAARLTQPAFPEARTSTSVRVEFSSYPIILSPVNPLQEVFPGYHELRGTTGPERYFPSIAFRGAVLYNLQANFPFTYAGDLNPPFQDVIISAVDLRGQFDLRDNLVRPHQGFLLQNSLQFAGSIFGGSAQDIRLRPELRMYVPITNTVTFAARGLLGLLWPRNYGATLGTNFLAIPNAVAAEPFYRDLQITYFRGFFSGGPDSNRGYAYRAIGPHGVNPLVIPGSFAEEQARCTPTNPSYNESVCFTASGGLTLWEASLEVRTPVYGDFGAVFFLDASDVSANQLDVRLYVPHLSAGFGVRYQTPVGPARLDLGFRIPGAQQLQGVPNPLLDGPPPGTFLGIPVALAIGIGEAY